MPTCSTRSNKASSRLTKAILCRHKKDRLDARYVLERLIRDGIQPYPANGDKTRDAGVADGAAGRDLTVAAVGADRRYSWRRADVCGRGQFGFYSRQSGSSRGDEAKRLATLHLHRRRRTFHVRLGRRSRLRRRLGRRHSGDRPRRVEERMIAPGENIGSQYQRSCVHIHCSGCRRIDCSSSACRAAVAA
jgi:hypothetical protein